MFMHTISLVTAEINGYSAVSYAGGEESPANASAGARLLSLPRGLRVDWRSELVPNLSAE